MEVNGIAFDFCVRYRQTEPIEESTFTYTVWPENGRQAFTQAERAEIRALIEEQFRRGGLAHVGMLKDIIFQPGKEIA